MANLFFVLQLKPFRSTLIPVAQDHLGMVPDLLEKALEDWKKKCEIGGGKMPKMIYVNPTGEFC